MVVCMLAAPSFAQSEGAVDFSKPSGTYIGFKSAEDKGQGLDAWFRFSPALTVITAGIMPPSHPGDWIATSRYVVDGRFAWSADYAREQDSFLMGFAGQAWRLSGAYRLTDDVSLGVVYGQLGYAPAAALNTDNSGWGLVGRWNIETSHTFSAGYVRANGTSAVPLSLASVNAQLAIGGADMWQLLYEYAFSQRTTLDVRYATSGSETGAFYLNPDEGAPPDSGSQERSLGISVKHRF